MCVLRGNIDMAGVTVILCLRIDDRLQRGFIPSSHPPNDHEYDPSDRHEREQDRHGCNALFRKTVRVAIQIRVFADQIEIPHHHDCQRRTEHGEAQAQ